MDKKRVVILAAVLAAAIAGLKYKEFRDEQELVALQARTKFVPPPKVVRSWRWPEEPEWAVHQVLRRIASWTLKAEGAPLTVAVRRQEGSKAPGVFEVSLSGAPVRSLVIRPTSSVWDAGPYVEAAAALLGPADSPAGAPVPGVAEGLLTSDTPSLVAADRLLFAAMSERPRDPRLHEQAALLWAAHAMRESARGRVDPRPFLNGVAAHLALARALAPSAAPSTDALISAIVTDLLLQNQTTAMDALEKLRAVSPDPGTAAWVNALRVRVTHDPRLPEGTKPRTRLEKLEYLIALRASRQDCSVVMPTAERWGIAPAADWAREALRCFDEQYLMSVGHPLVLQSEDASALAEVNADTIDGLISGLTALSSGDFQQPGPPAAVVPRELRAEAGLRHIAGAYELVVDGIASKSWKGGTSRFRDLSADFRASLPHAAFLDLLPDRREPTSNAEMRKACAAAGRMITDRPDLLSDSDWSHLAQCIGEPALRGLPRNAWDRVNIAGTGLFTTGPFHVGFAADTDEYDAAVARAPWDPRASRENVVRKAKKVLPHLDLVTLYARVIDYDVNAMMDALQQTYEGDRAEPLAARACAVEADACAAAGRRLAALGRYDAALPLGKRALAEAHGQIALSQNMSWYVSLLQERGQAAEAMRIAERMANVYSGSGLQTLAKAHERMGQFKEAVEVLQAMVDRYGPSDDLDTFYVRHAQRHGAAPFEEETSAATARLFPEGIRRMTIEQAGEAKRPLSLNNRVLFDRVLEDAGLSAHDSVVALDGFVVQTQEQYLAVMSFSDEPMASLLVKRQDGRVEEVKAPYFRSHYGLVVKGKGPRI